MQVADRIQIRRDTAANWTSASPTLANGELGLETDTGRLKAGDGSTTWTSLAYYTLGTTGAAMYSDAVANFANDLQKGGSTVPALGDTTANFTGTLQQGGSNVVVDSDIGSTVQAHDANLTSFLGAVDLPTADGSADQVLQTSGSGSISWADMAAGSSFVNFSKGTVSSVPMVSAVDIADGRVAASTSYTQLWRTGSNGTNSTVGNVFTWISGNHKSSSPASTSFSAMGLVVTPSTKTISVTTPETIWENPSYTGISTWQGTGCEGGGEMVCHGNIAWPGQTSHKFGYAIYRQSPADGSSAAYTMGGFTGDSHGANEPHYSLPYNTYGSTRAFVVGYNQNSSSQAAYRVFSGAGVGSLGTMGGVNQCPNTNTSTVQAVTMFTHPLITSASLFPNSGSHNLPSHICAYGTANGYSKIAVDTGNNVGSEVTTGFNRSHYSSQTAFLVKDPSSTGLKLFNYDYYGQCCEWTSTTQTYDRGTWGTMLPFNLNAHKYLLMPAAGLNEYMICGTQGYPYYAPMAFFKFTIDYATGTFTNIKVLPIDNNTDMLPLNSSYTYAKALYGDNEDISSAPTHILWTGFHGSGDGWAFIADYPADSLFAAL